ncbi:hypothetical protein IID20_01625 [Patescibacteria group bacterium]|nr:hypothetical protein [Patescibacteria group bacterium]
MTKVVAFFAGSITIGYVLENLPGWIVITPLIVGLSIIVVALYTVAAIFFVLWLVYSVVTINKSE